MFSYDRVVREQTEHIERLREALADVLTVTDIRPGEDWDTVALVGRLKLPPEPAYALAQAQCVPLNCTPVFRRREGQDWVIVARGLTPPVRFRAWVNGVLLALTLVTTLLAGASFNGRAAWAELLALWQTPNLADLLALLAAGAPFALTLLFILGVHEMGHYLAARHYGLPASLPYFIPFPMVLGTLGAFVRLPGPVPHRRALFDVGIAGPLAGLAVAVPLMALGLWQSEVTPVRWWDTPVQLSPLVWVLQAWVRPPGPDQTLIFSPVAQAAWFSLVITGFNLLPIGQFDGGHIAAALLGHQARWLGRLTLLGLGALGLLWAGWWVWAVFALWYGNRHAQTLNDLVTLDRPRIALGVVTLLSVAVLLSLKPF